MPDLLLDGAKIARLRSTCGMSQRGLARAAGLNSVSISLIEKGHNHPDLTLRQLRAIANELQVSPQAIFVDGAASGGATEAGDAIEKTETALDDQAARAPDDVMVEAALACVDAALTSTALARALGWPLSRVSSALLALDRRLKTTGQRLHRASNGYSLIPADVLERDRIASLTRLRLRTGGMSVTMMRLLYQAMQKPLDKDWERVAGNANRVNRGALQNAGLLVPSPDGLTLSDEAKTSLRLAPR